MALVDIEPRSLNQTVVLDQGLHELVRELVPRSLARRMLAQCANLMPHRRVTRAVLTHCGARGVALGGNSGPKIEARSRRS